MDIVINSKKVFSFISSYAGVEMKCRDNNTLSWSLNALIRYWNDPQPTMFRYNKSKDKPLTEEERKQWGI